MADVQAVGGGVEAEVGGQRTTGQRGAQAVGIGTLVNEAALFEQGQQVGIKMGYCSLLGDGDTPGETELIDPVRLRRIGLRARAYRLGEVR